MTDLTPSTPATILPETVTLTDNDQTTRLSAQDFSNMSIADILQLSDGDIRNILSQAPIELRPTDSDSSRDLIAKAATFRATFDPATAARRGEEAWTKLIGLTNKEIINEAMKNASAFSKTLRDIVSYRPSLTFPSEEEGDIGGMASVAIEWVSKAVNANPEHDPTAGMPIRQAIVPTTSPLNTNHRHLADRTEPDLDISDVPGRVRRESTVLPNLPEHLNHPSIIPMLRRLKSIKQSRFPTPEISRPVFRGPGILVGFLQHDTTISHHVAKCSFATLENGRAGASEFEAVSIARSLDLRLGSFPTAYHFLSADLSAEVDLRRLYALLKVESMTKLGWSRGDAWSKMMQVLEIAPSSATSYQELDEEINNAYSVIQKENYYRSHFYNRSARGGRGRGRVRGGRGSGSSSYKRPKPDPSSTTPVEEN